MQVVVKMLMAFEVPDDPAGRARFRRLESDLAPHFPDDGELREFKMIEDGTGRLVAKSEKP